MILELTTTSLGIATALGGSVLTGTTSSMDSVRRFFLSEKSDIDKILNNSREFEEKYLSGDNLYDGYDFEEEERRFKELEDGFEWEEENRRIENENENYLDQHPEEEKPWNFGYSSAEILKGTSDVITSVFKLKYVLIIAVLGFAYKLIRGGSYENG